MYAPVSGSVGTLLLGACLTLRELEALSRLRAARLLALDLSRVSGQHALFAQRAAVVLVEHDQSAGDAHAERVGLPGQTPTGGSHDDVEATLRGDGLERLFDAGL